MSSVLIGIGIVTALIAIVLVLYGKSMYKGIENYINDTKNRYYMIKSMMIEQKRMQQRAKQEEEIAKANKK